MKLRNQAIPWFLLSVAAFWALCTTGRSQVGESSSPAVGGQRGTAAVKTNGCLQYTAWHSCCSGEIITGAAEAKAILEGGRYTAEGSGPALYVELGKSCPWSQAFFKDRARFHGVQLRYYPNDETVQVLVSRSLPDFLSYMDGTLRPPPAGLGPVSDSALKDMGYRYGRLAEIATENGLRWQDFKTPVFFWIGSGRVFLATGFGRREYETGIIASVKSAAAGSRESAGSPAAGEITADAAEVKTLLEGGRYTADGSGPALYAFVSQSSSPSKEFFKDRAQFSGVQFRYYPMYLKTDSGDQVVQAMESRSVPDFLSFTNRTLRAPPIRQDNARIGILNDLVRRNQRLNEILTQNDGVSLFRLSPGWFWIADGKVYWTFGYTPEYMTEIVASVKSSPSAGGR